MIDLETWGTRPGSAITQIGAVRFTSKGITEEFSVLVSLKSCMDAGLTVEPSTVLWWMKQADEARAGMQESPATCSLDEALSLFVDWFTRKPVEAVWGNGAAFDNTLLVSAFEAVKLIPPWDFRADRCYRTMKNEYPDVTFVREGVAHNALNDAYSQAKHLIAIWKWRAVMKG